MQLTQIIAYVAIVFEGCGEAHLLLMQCSIGCYTCNMQTNVRYALGLSTLTAIFACAVTVSSWRRVDSTPFYPFVCSQLVLSPSLSNSCCPSFFGLAVLALLAFVVVFVFLLLAFTLLACLFISMTFITQLLHRSSDTVTSLEMDSAVTRWQWCHTCKRCCSFSCKAVWDGVPPEHCGNV